MSVHNVTREISSSTGIIMTRAGRITAPGGTIGEIRNSEGHILVSSGTAVPATTTPGYAAGSLFVRTDATTPGDLLYFNIGSSSSCVFVPETYKIPIVVTVPLTLNSAAIDQHAWINTTGLTLTVVSIAEVHATAGTDAGSVQLNVRKITDASAPGASAGATVKELLASPFNLKSTANAVVFGTLTSTSADLDIANGDKISLDFLGTMTAYAGGVVSIRMVVK